MPPREAKSTIPGLKYPTDRDIPVKTPEKWLEARRKDDQTEGLWRIHDKLYDLTDFINKHPGGPEWLSLTKAMDITEAFETAHLRAIPDALLERYYVKEATTPRIFPFTFHPDGFYNTFKRRVREILKDQPNRPSWRLCFTIDGSVILAFSLFFLSLISRSYLLAALGGIFLAMAGTASHNFFHQRDNFRMYYFDLMMMSSYEWRITHILSHHLYANTVQDMEITGMEPFFEFLPTSDTKMMVRILSILFGVFGGVLFSPHEFVRRVILITRGERVLRWENLLVIYQLMFASVITGSLWTGWCLWITFHMVSSYTFAGLAAIASPHHHPYIFHDGDTPRIDLDWGLCQVDAIRDKRETTGSLFLGSITFGDHTLHHLFPTLDYSLLPQLYPTLEKTLNEFGVPWRLYSFRDLFFGNFQQLLRTKINPLRPWTYEKYLKGK